MAIKHLKLIIIVGGIFVLFGGPSCLQVSHMNAQSEEHGSSNMTPSQQAAVLKYLTDAAVQAGVIKKGQTLDIEQLDEHDAALILSVLFMDKLLMTTGAEQQPFNLMVNGKKLSQKDAFLTIALELLEQMQGNGSLTPKVKNDLMAFSQKLAACKSCNTVLSIRSGLKGMEPFVKKFMSAQEQKALDTKYHAKYGGWTGKLAITQRANYILSN